MADFIHVRTINEVDFLINTDNILSLEQHANHTEITLVETDAGGSSLLLDTRETIDQLIVKLRDPLVRPAPPEKPWPSAPK